MNRTAFSGWTSEDPKKWCTEENAWKIASLIYDPSKRKNENSDNDLVDARRIITASKGWHEEAWPGDDIAREKLISIGKTLLSRAYPVGIGEDPHTLVCEALKLIEDAGLGRGSLKTLTMAANFLSQKRAELAIQEILDSAQTLLLWVFLGQDRESLTGLLRDDKELLSHLRPVLGRRNSDPNVVTHVRVHTIPPKDTLESDKWESLSLDFVSKMKTSKEFGKKVTRRTFELFYWDESAGKTSKRTQKSSGSLDHVGDLWVFTSPSDSSLFSTLSMQDTKLHAEVKIAFKTAFEMRKPGPSPLHFSTQSVHASPDLVKMLLRRYGYLDEDEHVFDMLNGKLPSGDWRLCGCVESQSLKS